MSKKLLTNECEKHGPYTYVDFDACPKCTRILVLREAAIQGLELVERTTRDPGPGLPKRHLRIEVARAIEFLRNYT